MEEAGFVSWLLYFNVLSTDKQGHPETMKWRREGRRERETDRQKHRGREGGGREERSNSNALFYKDCSLGERERERSKTLFYNDCSLGSVKPCLTTSPC